MIAGRLAAGLPAMFVLQRTGVLGFAGGMELVFAAEGACSFCGFAPGACIIGTCSESEFTSGAGAFEADGSEVDMSDPTAIAVDTAPCGRGGKGRIAGLRLESSPNPSVDASTAA